MINGYMTIKEVAEVWEITPRRIQILCSEGRIDGAEKVGKMWFIPTSAEKPKDARETTGKYKNWRKDR